PGARRCREMSLLTRVFLANGAVLAVITLLLLFSPIEISYPVTGTQSVILVTGFVVSLAINLLLLRRVVGPLRRLTSTMRSVMPLDPGRRLVIPGADTEVQSLTTAFNDMLERLETERRESGRGAVAAQEEERRRVARELHDEVGQVLTGVMLQLDDPEAREAVRRSLEDVRRIARELRPEMLDDLGLQSALRALCTTTAAQDGLWVERRLDAADMELRPEVELVVYRVAQESLTNVMRHSGASEVLVALHEVDGALRLIVRDNGRGLPAVVGEGGTGIGGMSERALHVGGRQTIGSGPGGGTEVRLDIPVPGALDGPSRSRPGSCWRTITRWSGAACGWCSTRSRTWRWSRRPATARRQWSSRCPARWIWPCWTWRCRG
ncbi:MAG: two-component system, NarL family, sensor histidine kinase UhpB, partial [Thermoleophilaceae bacterium]|nr:two-component system, NarL family, sensor histidine kinase UhpB [Thermoleophilaceae bacterium]